MRPWCFKHLKSAGTLLAFSCLLSLSQTTQAAMVDITRIYQTTPTPGAFSICSGGGCANVHAVSLNEQEWQAISRFFEITENTISNAEQERALIASAIAQFEIIIGEKTNTSLDLAGTFNRATGQMDCNDEAINTITYLRLLQSAGLITHHQVTDIRIRNYFFAGWPHSAASMRDITTREDFVVDSWFYDNGEPPVILPLATWKSGFTPQTSPLFKK